MADQGRWFKLWVSSPDDPDLDNLTIADYGRWAKFGAYLKEHGTDGTVTLPPPCRTLQSKFQVDTFEAVIECIRKFPNCAVTPVTNSSVTYLVEWKNWPKYQGDFSGDRVRRHREKKRRDVTAKRRREEKRGDEKPPSVPSPDEAFLRSLRENPAYRGIDLEVELGRMRGWLSTPRGKGRKLTRQFIVNWLNKIDRPVEGAGQEGDEWRKGLNLG